MDKVFITYNGQEIKVDKAIADYLESERLREQAEEKSDSRHLSDKLIEREDFFSFMFDCPDDFVDDISNQSEVEHLRKALSILTETQLRRVKMYFFEGLTYEEIAKIENKYLKAIQDSITQSLKKIKLFLDRH